MIVVYFLSFLVWSVYQYTKTHHHENPMYRYNGSHSQLIVYLHPYEPSVKSASIYVTYVTPLIDQNLLHRQKLDTGAKFVLSLSCV